jgi:hypothetical protein
MKSLTTATITLTLVLLISMPTLAETPRIFLEERTNSEKLAYLYGSLETAMVMTRRLGNPEKSDCIKDWFAGHSEEANKELMSAIHQVKDKEFPVASVIVILIERHCGKLNIE